MIKSNKNSNYIALHTLDDISAHSTPGTDRVIEGRSSGGEIPTITNALFNFSSSFGLQYFLIIGFTFI